jgi:hypothetical protein
MARGGQLHRRPALGSEQGCSPRCKEGSGRQAGAAAYLSNSQGSVQARRCWSASSRSWQATWKGPLGAGNLKTGNSQQSAAEPCAARRRRCQGLGDSAASRALPARCAGGVRARAGQAARWCASGALLGPAAHQRTDEEQGGEGVLDGSRRGGAGRLCRGLQHHHREHYGLATCCEVRAPKLPAVALAPALQRQRQQRGARERGAGCYACIAGGGQRRHARGDGEGMHASLQRPHAPGGVAVWWRDRVSVGVPPRRLHAAQQAAAARAVKRQEGQRAGPLGRSADQSTRSHRWPGRLGWAAGLAVGQGKGFCVNDDRGGAEGSGAVPAGPAE